VVARGGVVGDQFGGEWPRETFRAHGIDYELAEHARSDLYLGLLPPGQRGQVALFDRPDFLRELRAWNAIGTLGPGPSGPTADTESLRRGEHGERPGHEGCCRPRKIGQAVK
jgi:hypothetical protein